MRREAVGCHMRGGKLSKIAVCFRGAKGRLERTRNYRATSCKHVQHKLDAPLQGALLVLSLLIPCGCGKLQAPPVNPDTGQAAAKVVDWYFDATLSMQGFVQSRMMTEYDNFVDLLDQQVTNELGTAPRKLHRFGTTTEDFVEMTDTRRPDTYEAREGFKDTDLSVAASNIRPDSLTIIVTDLFQTDNYMEGLHQLLLKEGLGSKFQFAILGERARFDGTIYDIKPAGTSLRWRNGPRPVYALLFGPSATLRALLTRVLAKNDPRAPRIEAALVSAELGTLAIPVGKLARAGEDGSVPEGNVPYLSAPGFDDWSHLVGGDVKPWYRELRTSRNSRKPSITVKDPIKFEPFELVPDADKWQPHTTVQECERPNLYQRITLLLHLSGEAAGAAGGACRGEEQGIVYSSSISPPNKDARTLSGPISLDFGKRGDDQEDVRLASGALYVVELDLSARGEDVHTPAWVEDYSVPSTAKFVPTKTQDLARFMENMQQAVYKAAQPTAMKAVFYLKSE